MVAGLLVVLAVAGLANAVFSGTAARRRDIATLRALGFTPRQVRGSVLSHSVTLALVGLVVGVPAGFVVGKAAWDWFATGLSLDRSVALSLPLVAAVASGTLAAAVLFGVPAGRRLVRSRAAIDLRAE